MVLRGIAFSVVGFLLVAFSGLSQEPAEGTVNICPINGMVDDGIKVLVERVVRESKDADAIVFVIDTPGGLLDAAIEISKYILDAPCPTVAYIEGMGAISAGALISFSCDEIIMAPDTNMGAATPVLMSTEGPKPTSEKEVSFMRAKMRALAEAKSHNPAIAEAMVDKDIELRLYENERGESIVFSTSRGPEKEVSDGGVREAILRAVDGLPEGFEDVKRAVEGTLKKDEPEGGESFEPPGSDQEISLDATEVILEEGKLLTLTANEALRYGVITATAEDVDGALAFLGYGGLEKIEKEMTWSEALFRWLASPMVSGLLLMIGIGGLYMEMKTPGFGVFGAVGAGALALFFGSHLVIGLAEWIDLLLVLAGVSLIATEIFVIPGFGVAGISGIVCLIIGLYLSLTRVPLPRYSWDFARLQDAGISLLTAMASLTAFLYVMYKIFPHTPFAGWLILADNQSADDGYVVQTKEQTESAVGLAGVATSMLRPVGRGRFGDKTLQVVSYREYIPGGTPIKIVRAEGNRYVVERQIPEHEDEEESTS